MMDGRLILDNILAGRTAMGRECPDAGELAIAFTDDLATRMAMYAALDLTSRMFGDVAYAEDNTFTAFARKMVFFARKCGVQQEHPSFLTRAGLAAEAALERIALLSTRVGFAPLVERGSELKAIRRPPPPADVFGHNPQLTRSQEIALMREKADAPAPRVYWRSDDESLTLVELVHPFHLWEEGMKLNNCLARTKPRFPSSAVKGTDPASKLYQIKYWTLVSKGQLRIFSLRRGKTTAAVFSMQGATLRELTVHLPNAPDLWNAFADILDIFEDDLGPIASDLGQISGNTNLLLWSVLIERARRGRCAFPVSIPVPCTGLNFLRPNA